MEHEHGGGMGGDVANLRLSEGLRDAFAGLSDAELPPEDRQRWQHRLIAVTNLAKHDVGRAEAQLDRLLAELRRDLADGPAPAGPEA